MSGDSNSNINSNINSTIKRQRVGNETCPVERISLRSRIQPTTARQIAQHVTVGDQLHLQELWKEVDLYYRRFSKEDISLVLDDCSFQSHTKEEDSKSTCNPSYVDQLLSCLIPQEIPPNSIRKSILLPIPESASIITEEASFELQNLEPFVVEELYERGLLEMDRDLPLLENKEEVSVKTEKEVDSLQKEIEDCV